MDKMDSQVSNTLNPNEQSISDEFLILRGRFPQIMCHENLVEDKWRCDICLSPECEDADPLNICDLCLVVVHPSCYRKDLYSAPMDDYSPWFCNRCDYLVSNSAGCEDDMQNVTLP
jgi:hypothetical protein